MARKGQVSIQENIESNEEFQALLESNFNILICMEVYSDFCGYCLATGNAIRKGKLEIGQDRIVMAKKGKLTRAMFGANGIELCRIIEEEVGYMQKEIDTGVERPKQEVQELLPEEALKIEEDLKLEEETREVGERLRVLTVAARKKRVCKRLAEHVKQLNFIMFWPHCHQAHYDLYEKWDMINISVAAKEVFQLDEHAVKEALYMSDIEPNEACLHALMSGEVLVVLFKMLDTDFRDFVALLRYALYKQIPVPKEDVPPEKQVPPIPAYKRYATISKTAREVRRDRYEVKMEKLRKEKEDRDRLAAEEARLAREAEEERLRLEKQRQEEERMARIQAGLPADPEPVEVGEEDVEGEETEKATMEATEEPPEDILDDKEKVEAEEEFHSDVSVEGEEYIPPGGLFVPGLYSPPNDLAKANGLAFFYPKVVQELTIIESEHLPPHVLVMFTVDKRHEVQEVMQQYPDDILNAGIFIGDDPHSAEHLAYTIKQYDKMERVRKNKDRLALMVSRKRSLAMLQLAGLNPCYISHDLTTGERDCLTLFPVGYADNHFEEESVREEEEIMETAVEPEAEPETVAVEETEENEDDDEEEED